MRILVLDSGLAADRPDFLAAGVTGDETDIPDSAFVDHDKNTHPADGVIDPVAGHGTFIAGLLRQHAPGCHVVVGDHVTPIGIVIESSVAAAVFAASLPNRGAPSIISLSFGGRMVSDKAGLHRAIAAATEAGIVVVASAGNNADCRPHYPAAWPEVVGVGALGPDGPAPFTNHGDWVDACAAGVDLVSTFFDTSSAAVSVPGAGVTLDAFDGWAAWSGTSFATPVVAAAIAREIVLRGVDAMEARAHVVEAAHLPRLPGLGTIVGI